jgi:hypothetical protein
MTLPERISRYLERLEPAIAGQHGHDMTFKAACALTHGFALGPEQALPFMLEYNRRCEPEWNEADLRRKLVQAASHPGHQKARGHLLGANLSTIVDTPPTHESQLRALSKPDPKWPACDLETINRIVLEGPALYDLWESSPVRFGDSASHAEEIVDALFPGDPLLCCGKSKSVFATRRRETWRGHLARLALIVPSPMYKLKGYTQEGKLSEHTKEATAQRIYLVVEFDFSEIARDGKTETKWAPLVRDWRAKGLTVADACAALHHHLSTRLPLVCATHSGGKSLHGWYSAFDQTDGHLRLFMHYAVSIGADSATWTCSQFVRLPDGTRDNGKRQVTYYLDPGKAVKL